MDHLWIHFSSRINVRKNLNKKKGPFLFSSRAAVHLNSNHVFALGRGANWGAQTLTLPVDSSRPLSANTTPNANKPNPHPTDELRLRAQGKGEGGALWRAAHTALPAEGARLTGVNQGDRLLSKQPLGPNGSILGHHLSYLAQTDDHSHFVLLRLQTFNVCLDKRTRTEDKDGGGRVNMAEQRLMSVWTAR